MRTRRPKGRRWRRERRVLSMLKRHEVEILLKAGHGKTEVARLTGVSLCSVKLPLWGVFCPSR